MRFRLAFLLLALLLTGGWTLAGYEQEGPAERAGERMDEAVEEAGDDLEDAADDLENATDP